jgi:hypothetical protein
MAFPVSPIDGESTLVNGITYLYSSATNAWTRAVSPLGNLTVTGNVFSNRLYTTTGLFWAGNGVAFSSGTGGGGGINITTDTVPPGSPNVGDQWYATDIEILFEYIDDGDSQQWVDITSSAIAANTVVNLSQGDFSILGHITPGINMTYDLGNVNYKWRDIYVDGVTNTGNISTISGVFWANGVSALYGNTQTAQYLTNYTGNVAAGNVITTNGVFWSNGAPYTSGRQATSYSMNMIFGI